MCKAMLSSCDATRNKNRAIASDWELLSSVSVDFLDGRGPHVVSSHVFLKRESSLVLESMEGYKMDVHGGLVFSFQVFETDSHIHL